MFLPFQMIPENALDEVSLMRFFLFASQIADECGMVTFGMSYLICGVEGVSFVSSLQD